ncbi:MAG TPA: hypothetical protein VLB84_05465, partial [Bacteroidia bacterium]|nr:hypothetical protein [Bacteroidia bacterium]
ISMFSKGQLIFALVFFVCFVVGIVLAYRKDKFQNNSFFKGSYKVLIFIVFVFVALYGVVKLKHLF